MEGGGRGFVNFNKLKAVNQPETPHHPKDKPAPKNDSFFLKGALVWYKSKTHSWVPGEIESQKDREVIVNPLDDEGKPDSERPQETILVDDVIPIQTTVVPESVDDMVSLSDLNEPSILHNLRLRYGKDVIYTYVGPILVSVNPYKPLSVFKDDTMKLYPGKPFGSLPPHIYAIAEASYRSMRKDRKNQSILISGETGAGKTEATKYIMRYLASIAKEEGGIEKKLLEAHPILEAFGNARTLQNNNSSRFGKFFQVFFHSSGAMAGATINHYLLEKSRVVIQAEDERNYHIFYQFLSGATAEEKVKYMLSDPENFEYLNQSGCFKIEGIDDAKHFQDVKRAFTILTIAEQEQESVFRLLAALLHLGNLKFGKDSQRQDAAFITNKEVLDHVATLLCCNASDLESGLCNRNMSARAQSVYTIPLKMDEAMSTRNALSKTIYAAIFDWLIKRINTTLVCKSSDYFIGILDIFGFESFELNSFEQFCINYANEKLQQHFNKHLFKVEQEEYVREKINWGQIHFEDNQEVVDLIEKKPLGLLSILDEECNFPKGTDQSFLDKISKHFEKSKVYKKPLRTQGVFTIVHFAGEVTYDTDGFLNKNKDSIHGDLITLLQGSKDSFINQVLFPTESKKDKKLDVPKGPAKLAAPKKITLGGQFRDQLLQLMNVLGGTEPHFIRAIKPNNDKKPNRFEGINALRQLRYSGLLETIRIRASGYVYRPSFEEFFSKYKHLAKGIDSQIQGQTPKRKCEILLFDFLKVDKAKVQLGLTKLFMKEVEFTQLNKMSEEKYKDAAVKIQNRWRTYHLNHNYKATRSGAVTLQCAIRAYYSRRDFKKHKRDKEKKEREEREKRAREELEKKEREEKERLEKEKKERLEREKKEKEEREKREREEKEKAEREEKQRLERERKEKLEKERQDKIERERKEKEEKELKEKAEKEREEKERVEREEKARVERERKEKEEQERKEKERKLLEEKQRKEQQEAEILKAQALLEEKERKEAEARQKEKEQKEKDVKAVVLPPVTADMFPDTPSHALDLSKQNSAPPKKPAVTPTGELVMERPKSKPPKENAELKKQLESSLQKGLENPEIRSNPVKAHKAEDISKLQGLQVPTGDPAKEDEEAKKLQKKNEELAKKVGNLEDMLGKAKMEVESEKTERLVQERLLEEEKKRNVEKDAKLKKEAEVRQKLAEELAEKERKAKEVQAAPAPIPTQVAPPKAPEPVFIPPQPTYFVPPPQPMAYTTPSYFVPLSAPPVEEPSGPLYPNLTKLAEEKQQASVAPIKPKENAEVVPSTGTRSYNLNLFSAKSDTLPPVEQPSEAPSAPITMEMPSVSKTTPTATLIAESSAPVVASVITEEEMTDGLKFESITKTPALSIPVGKGVTKYDYSKAKSEPFSFKSIEHAPEPDEKPEALDVAEPFEIMDEPEIGTEPETVDVEAMIKTRMGLPFSAYRPLFFKFPEEVPPLRPPDRFLPNEKIESYEQLPNGDPNTVTYIRIVETNLTKDQKKGLHKQLNTYRLTQVLILRKLQLEGKHIESIALQDLRYVDISQNSVADVTPILDFLKNSPNLEIAIIADNPACFKPAFRDRIIAACPNLRRINEKEIDTEERLRAIAAQGTKSQKKNIDLMRWDLAFSTLPCLKDLPAWDSDQITKVVLTNCRLTCFHVGSLPNLQELDLSHNQIFTLLGTGIEQCQSLVRCKLSHNKIVHKKELRVFEFTSKLQYLWLEGNRDTQKELSNYRSAVIFITRNVKGTNRCCGLIELDGSPISTEERINAVAAHSKKKTDPQLFRWYLCLMDYYGHHQMKTPNYLSRIKHLRLPNSNLSMVDLRGLFSLEVLDLSGNALVTVDGLKELPKLRFLNLSGNPRLDLAPTLDQLKDNMYLEQVSFGVMEETHKLFFNSKKYREKVLASLLMQNIKLKFVDNILITPEERVETLRLIPSYTKDDVEKYRFELALVMNTVLPGHRKYHYTEVSIGLQYNPKNITSLRKLNNYDLIWCDFRQFVALEELNLAGNKLNDITTMGLDELKGLRVLDVTNNNIQLPLKDLANFLDRMPALECIALRNNPIMKTDADRKKLIGLMTSTREVTCMLQVIDTVVTIDERIDAWISAGGLPDEAELMRYKAVMYQRMPRDIDPTLMTTLDLNDAGFKKVDVRKFVSLEILLLRGNQLTTVEDTGINTLTKLSVLDLRDNSLSKMEEIVGLIRLLPSLTTLGLGGNKCTDSKNWRQKLLIQLPELHQKHCSLRRLDDEDIKVEEIVEAWKSMKDNTVDQKNYRFHVLTFFKLPETKDLGNLTELDFSGCGLTNVDLSTYPRLKKLSLANNELKTLDVTNIRVLNELEGLDVRGNKIKELDGLITVIKDLPKLQAFFLDNNPCFPQDTEEYRIKFFSKWMVYVNPKDTTLKSLNGKLIKMQEKVRSFKKMKNPPFNVEEMRLDLCLVEKQIQEEHAYLDISGYEFTSLLGIQGKLPKLTHLNVANNFLKSLEIDVFKMLPFLSYLDISNNQISSIAHILEVLQSNPLLETLVMVNATGTKETALPREYAFKVCKVLRTLLTVDGLKNPFGTLALRKPQLKRTPTVMRMAESMQQESPDQVPVDAQGQLIDPTTQEKQRYQSSYMYDLAAIYKDIQFGPQSNWDALYKPSVEDKPSAPNYASYG